MRLSALPLLLALTLTASSEAPANPPAELPAIALPIRFTMPGPNELAIAAQQQNPPSGSTGYYTPVAPRQQQGPPCGHYGTPVCKVDVDIPRGATGEQLYQMAKEAMANHQNGASLTYLEKSAELGYPVAQGALGMAYINANGEPRDPVKGVYWLEKSADQGNRGAQIELGMVYEDGQGVPANPIKAVTYLKLAAAQHQSLAEFRLGLDYEIARGLPHNRAAALEYLRAAAADGQAQAGRTATFLAQTKAPPFRSIDDIDAAMNPTIKAKPNTSGVGCPDFADSSWQGTAGNVVSISRGYCTVHPNCPFHARNNLYYCAGDQTPIKLVLSFYP
jgi:hypothetical protein